MRTKQFAETPRLKRLCAAVLAFCALSAAGPLAAKVYYINRGVRYHVGDNHYDKSEDALFVGTYPVVGQEWIQAFRATEDDVVKVNIGHIWGVDDCPYCKDMISINEHLMGRLFAENNHKPFDTPQPLACPVKKGRIYYLKIASYSLGNDADDFVFSDVVVESDKADIVFLQPGPIIKMPDQPMPPVFEPSRPAGESCDNLAPDRNWMLGWDGGRPKPENLAAGTDFVESGQLASLAPGQSLDLSFTLGRQAMDADRVDYALEVLAGPDEKSGWVFQFHDRVAGLYHGNMRVDGRYTARSFQAALNKDGVNRVRLEYCPDGTLRLRLNGDDLEQSLDGLRGPQKISVRALGLPVLLAGGSS